jgi:hypothetical protein
MNEPRTTGRSRFHILQNGDKVFNVCGHPQDQCNTAQAPKTLRNQIH